MSFVFQNIVPPPPSPPGECVPPTFVAGGGHTCRVERGGGQYFGRRKTQLCTLPISNPLWLYVTVGYSVHTIYSILDVISTPLKMGKTNATENLLLFHSAWTQI
jgi:hypothetical protein